MLNVDPMKGGMEMLVYVFRNILKLMVCAKNVILTHLIMVENVSVIMDFMTTKENARNATLAAENVQDPVLLNVFLVVMSAIL